MSMPDLSTLDPGIRDVCAALWKEGILTTDSGDVGKRYEGSLDCEHVAVAPREGALEGSSPQLAIAQVLACLYSARPGQLWQVEWTLSRTSALNASVNATILAYRLNPIERTAASSFGELLREYREQAGYTMNHLSSHLGLELVELSDIELDRHRPLSSNQIKAAAEYLGLNKEKADRLMAMAREMA